ncbi:helix-turn-helix domain-containing protein [Streptoalloteichus hindustanus]|uniref:Helix-turn-helix domain-containing protein n=1 Tax=Streptoalloteichus hindustanus TaxID=2017 RepID=A0A1M4XNY5_STRHI|nr:helix-turn-helix transcriptional regulator [Streptoalloteichus hindustanus]SHE95307.1 Helix-turn-helix domain-containing protein [Streptoalloteichus hindustanus]
MPEDFRAGVRLRRVGRELRKWRNRAGLTLADAAKAVRWSSSKLSKIETASQPIQGVDVLAIALGYGVPEDERNQLYHAALTAQDPGWWQEYDDVLFKAAQDLAELESEASLVRSFHAQLIPGLFQTKSYFGALAHAWIPPASEEAVRQRAEARSTRQERLYGNNPLVVEAVIWEPVLRQVVGGPAVMTEQLDHLLALTEMANVTVQVLPALGAYPAMGSTFDVLSFGQDHYDDVVYLETLTHGMYVEEVHDVELYRLNFAGLQEASLDAQASTKLIAEIAGNMQH